MGLNLQFCTGIFFDMTFLDKLIDFYMKNTQVASLSLIQFQPFLKFTFLLQIWILHYYLDQKICTIQSKSNTSLSTNFASFATKTGLLFWTMTYFNPKHNTDELWRSSCMIWSYMQDRSDMGLNHIHKFDNPYITVVLK